MRTATSYQAGVANGPTQDAFVVLFDELACSRPDVFEHSWRVAELVGQVARTFPTLEMPAWEVERAALAHDIGKVAVPVSVLRKPSGLTPAERRLVEAHSVVGAELLSTLAGSETLASLARSHHERLDGTGYPDGLRGTHVPLGAQIIGACDAWDAMVNLRPYRRALSFSEAAAELRDCAGKHWRRDVVALTLDVVAERPRLAAAVPSGASVRQGRSATLTRPASAVSFAHR